MNDLICYRGPDDEGFVLFRDFLSEPVVAGGPDTPEQSWQAHAPYSPRKRIEQVADMPVRIALGHRRLSIIDLSPFGHQPMSYQNGRYWITYNGEIYNYTELRTELQSLGHHFLSLSDTEVILAAYAQWGANCLHRFNGMWAFAIYDLQRQEVFLARDRFGVKPLYYWNAPDGTFCFVSEIKQFTEFPGWAARINPQRVYDFLVWGLVDHTDETMFDRVYQLRPGHSIRLNVSGWKADLTGRLPVEKWYELKARKFTGNFVDAAVEFREHLKDSVRLRLRSDVPVGSCLSGGLDSTSIVCLMNQLLFEQGASAKQKTFSACSDVKRFDEREWIDTVVKATGVDPYYVYPSLETLFKDLPTITWHQDEPFATTTIYAQWNVFHLAADNGVKVMLDGQGADELLAGYHDFFGPHILSLFKRLKWLTLLSEIRSIGRLHGYSHSSAAKTIAGTFLSDGIRKRLFYRSIVPPWLNLANLKLKHQDSTLQLGKIPDSIFKMSYAQLTVDRLQILLHFEDRNSMAYSLEARVPFLDYKLVEFSLGLPDNFKIAGGVTKKILRASMDKVLPNTIINRMDKIGFATPEEIWVRERAPIIFKQKLVDSIDASSGIIKHEVINLLADIVAGRRPYDTLIWRLINLGEWIKVFKVAV